MTGTEAVMLQISRAIEAAEEAIIEAADRLRCVGDLIYDDESNPVTRLSYDEIECLANARKWLEAEYSTVFCARE